MLRLLRTESHVLRVLRTTRAAAFASLHEKISEREIGAILRHSSESPLRLIASEDWDRDPHISGKPPKRAPKKVPAALRGG